MMLVEETRDTSSATWKFEFEDTVNADPQAKGACLPVIRALLNYASKSDPRAFRSLPDLMLATACTRPTVRAAIKVLIRLGYLVPLYVTEGGSMMYKLVNARKQLIDDHLRVAAQSLAYERADRKKRERVRRGKEICPPKIAEGERILPPKVKESFPNTVELNRRGNISEGRDEPLGDPNTYLQPPEDPTEARIWLTSICADKSRLAEALIRLACKELTPEFLREIAA